MPRELVLDCVRVATQAPSRNNRQPWHFVFVDDPAKRAQIATVYRDAFRQRLEAGGRAPPAAHHLAANLERVPILLVPCVEPRAPAPDLAEQASMWGSILPAAWSFMLAARLHGLGTSWTTVHLRRAGEVARILALPSEGVVQAGLVPVAYTIGTDFRPAPRRPPEEVTHWNAWGGA